MVLSEIHQRFKGHYYLFIYSRIIKIKIKIYNNMQLKYVKNKIKQQHKRTTIA